MNKDKIITNKRELQEYLIFKNQLKYIGKIANSHIYTNFKNIYLYLYDNDKIKQIIIQPSKMQEIDTTIDRFKEIQEQEKKYSLLKRALATIIYELKIKVCLGEEPFIHNEGIEPILLTQDVYMLMSAFNLVKENVENLEIERNAIKNEVKLNQAIYEIKKENKIEYEGGK